VKENILGFGVDALSVDACADSIFATLSERAKTGRGCAWLACMNPHSYAVALGDTLFTQALKDSDWLVPDGAGVVMASRLLGGTIAERVTGSDIFNGLHQRMNAVGGMSVFFLGATEETLAQIRARMALDYPGITVAGAYSPAFKPTYSTEEIDDMINAINAVAPDVLWVGMTAPKQEKWIFEHRARLKVKFAGAIGAVFDFYTGRVKRSHPVFQRLGLEWLPRLIQQPRRLWRRMFVSAPVFVWHVLLQRLKG
jgi:N-acetylglucosaminyldiphosphoundecaprenol N-acetyl-beta-D-mannosaminyltransferase